MCEYILQIVAIQFYNIKYIFNISYYLIILYYYFILIIYRCINTQNQNTLRSHFQKSLASIFCFLLFHLLLLLLHLRLVLICLTQLVLLMPKNCFLLMIMIRISCLLVRLHIRLPWLLVLTYRRCVSLQNCHLLFVQVLLSVSCLHHSHLVFFLRKKMMMKSRVFFLLTRDPGVTVAVVLPCLLCSCLRMDLTWLLLMLIVISLLCLLFNTIVRSVLRKYFLMQIACPLLCILLILISAMCIDAILYSLLLLLVHLQD